MLRPGTRAVVLLLPLLATACDPDPVKHLDLDADRQADAPDTDGHTDYEPDTPAAALVTLPLGETLFFDGDDYLADLGANADCEPSIEAAPEGATAAIVDGHRLTPDVTGTWSVACGEWSTDIQVAADTLSADTFMNYNYTPVLPLADLGDGRMAVACPTSNAVQLVTLGDAPEAATLVPTGAWPTSVALWESGGLLLVTQTGRDTLGFLDPTTGQLTDAIQVGDEPAGIVVHGDTAYLTISGENRVVSVDLTTRTLTGSAATGRDPRALTLSPDGRRLYVASLISSNEHRHGTDDLPTEDAFRRDLTVVDTATFDVVHTEPDVGTMLRGMYTDGSRLIVGVSHSRNDQPDVDGHTRPHAHGLAVLALDEDALPTGDITDIDLDYREGSSGPAPSPFSIAPTPDGSQLVVSLSAGAELLLLDATTLAETGRIVTGNDPRGLVFADGHLWTSAWLDNHLHGYPVPLAPRTTAAHTIETGDDPRTEAIQHGARLFNDARFSATGEFSCNNCHIDGVVDGLTWDLLVDGNVNTLAFRNIAGTDPFLWGGLLPTLFDFSREVLKLVGANASGEDMEALTVYMQSITAPPNPHTLPGGRLTDSALRGKDLFEMATASGGAGCDTCHSGPLFTNQASVTGKTEGLETDVPGLIGVYDSAPYGRKGTWATLDDMVDAALDYTGATDLTDDQRADLVAYLQQLPGDVLWLNGALPLAGDDYVWTQSPVELTFSSVLAPGQADLASIHTVAEDGTETEVDGEWTVSGRVLRFAPAAGSLAEDTHYTVRVGAGLTASLGQVMTEQLELDWATGAAAELDVSGRHIVTLKVNEVFPGLVDEDPQAEFSLIQSSGGNVTAVVHYDDLGLELSHAEGVVVGSRFIIEPFQFDTDFGLVQLDAGFFEMEDRDGDGFADHGEGTGETFGYVVPWESERLTLPGE